MKKIFLCSDQDLIRERWRSLLVDQDYQIFQIALVEGLKQLIKSDDTFVLLVHQPFADLRTINEFCGTLKTCKAFVLADNPNEEEGEALLKQGVAGYANTYISSGRLLEAVKIIFSGRVWFNQEIINKLIQSINLENHGREGVKEDRLPSTLSRREREIVLLVSKGLSNRVIGERLYISERTVKTHLSTIFNKTGARSRLQLALLILRKA